MTSVLLGLLAAERGVSIVCLENDERWAAQVRESLLRNDIGGVQVETAPLVDYGAYDWYSVTSVLPDSIELVVCDGPPGSTRGGRFGALPVLIHKLQPGARILLDDAQRPEEQRIIKLWMAGFGLVSSELVPEDDGSRAYSILTVPDRSSSTDRA